MGEIKSTLDLVMEKTGHLTLSPEEKVEQEKEEAKKGLNGLLQKYQDQVISLEELKKELEALQKRYVFADDRFLVSEISRRITMVPESNLFVLVLTDLFDLNTDAIEAVRRDFQTKIREKAIKQMEVNKKQLSETHHISGSAVIPNLETDDAWAMEVQQITKKYDQLLEAEKGKIIKNL